MELFFERYCVIFISTIFSVLWYIYGKNLGSYIVADYAIVYQTMLMFSTIIVALMATVKAILLTADKNAGIGLIKTNQGMLDRFVGYIFNCIISNLFFVYFHFL